MKDLIIISGAPGSGKTVITELLRKELNFPPVIDFGYIRNFHLDRKWKNKSKKEEEMSFVNLVFIIKNYKKYGYKNVIVNDLEDYMIQKIPKLFSKYAIISLIIENNKELEKRVLDIKRDSGFRNVKKAIEWNKKLKKRKLLKNEFKIDNTHNKPKETVKEILKILKNE